MGTSARPWARLGSKLRTGRRRGEDEEQGASQGHGVRVGLGRASATFADSTVAFCIPMSPMLLLDSYLCAEIHHGSASHTQNSWCDPSGNAHATDKGTDVETCRAQHDNTPTEVEQSHSHYAAVT